MRNLKKFLALVLATMMLLSVAVISTSAAKKEYDYTDAAERLAALQVMKGNENGDLMLENDVTRYQAALFFVQALTGETTVETWNSTKTSAYFSDVAEYGTAIDYAYGINLIKGRGNGVYGYNDNITYQDMLVMAVRALGYETADMSYPYGYILAAQKLGLTENVELTDYKAALNRGETAQIIWDMLDTKVAVIDPITDKILYPKETGLTDLLLDASGVAVEERLTLMEESELVIDKVLAFVTEYNEAEDEDEEDTIVIECGEFGSVEVAASDLGLTADTAAVSYLGLPLDMYIDVKAGDFDQNEYDRDDAHIIFTVAHEFDAVLNLGDGNVKVVTNKDASKTYLNLGGTKFTNGRYQFNVAYFDPFDQEDGWTWLTKDVVLKDENGKTVKDENGDPVTYESMNLYLGETGLFAFEYDDDEYVYDTVNTFAQISFLETDRHVVDTDGEKDTIVEVLVTPLSFGQYNVRELKDRANASKLTNFATIAEWTGNKVENYDEEDSYFKETILGSNATVTSSTTSVSAKNGEKAKDVTLAGEAVEAGDFVFYAYNKMDNIFTVAKNCGNFETGRLTARNTAKETVKIGGTNYEFGFAGPANVSGMPTTWDDYKADIQGDYIEELEPGKDNVRYLAVDGKVVYMEPYSAVHNDSIYDSVIISLDPALVADVLNISDEKYANNLSGTVGVIGGVDYNLPGVYVADNGYVAVAVLSKTTGEWELGYIKSVESAYDYAEDEFTKSADVATLATYTDMFTKATEYNKFNNYVEAWAVLTSSQVLAAVEAEENVYTVAYSQYEYALTDDNGNYVDAEGNPSDMPMVVYGSFFVAGSFVDGKFAAENDQVECNGIIFSDNNTKTNAITADNEVEAERVVVDDETVIIVVDAVNGVAGARVGVQGADNSYVTANGYFLAASADLIILVDTEGHTTDLDLDNDGTKETTVPTVTVWSDGVVSGKNETWYLATVDTGVELENASEDEDEELYTITFTEVLDMKTLEIVDSVSYEIEDPKDDLTKFGAAGKTILHKKGEKLELEESMTFAEVIAKVSSASDLKVKFVATTSGAVDFVDNDTIEVPAVENNTYMLEGYKKAGEAVDIVVTVVTNNKVVDAEDYDFGAAVLNKQYTTADATTNDIWDIGSSLIYFGDKTNKVEYWSYPIDGEMVEEINEPVDGILDNYILAKDGATILVPEVDNGDYADAIKCVVDLDVAVGYEDGVVYLTVYKTISEK